MWSRVLGDSWTRSVEVPSQLLAPGLAAACILSAFWAVLAPGPKLGEGYGGTRNLNRLGEHSDCAAHLLEASGC